MKSHTKRCCTGVTLDYQMPPPQKTLGSSQIYKIISCILLYNDAKILFFYKIKRIMREKISKTGQNAWFWSRNRALWAVEKGSCSDKLRKRPCGLSGEGLRKVEKGGAGAVQKHYKKAHNLPRLRRKFYKLHSKLNKKRCDGLYPYTVSSFKFLVSSFVTQISQIFLWYNKIYGKMSKTSFHNYS